jgi:hypothetical protein
MQNLRRSLSVVRLVLAWFVLTMGMAVAAPIVQPQSTVLICSEGGSKMIVVDDDGNQVVDAGHSGLDCPLCLPVVLPPAFKSLRLPVAPPMTCAQHSFVSAHIAALMGAPLPARGPPLHS